MRKKIGVFSLALAGMLAIVGTSIADDFPAKDITLMFLGLPAVARTQLPEH